MTKKLRKRMLAILLMLIIFIGAFAPIKAQASVTTEEPLADELPTEGYISSELDFASIRTLGTVKGSHFILTEDINISGNWNPISDFKGTFDGGGHTITFNINYTTGAIPQTPYLGLFASCTDATIKNLYVQGNIELNTQGSYFNPNVYAGGIVASSTNSTLENVHFSGNINIFTSNDNSSWVGGLVGQATNTQISLSSSTATITTKANSYIGSTKAGGLCGEFSGKIENCYNMGNIQATAATDSPYAGGIVGNNKGAITQTYNSGKVKSEGPDINMSKVYAGGIAAHGETESLVTYCAVMSPEIEITTGWINSGDKYIISNGGNKSNNIAINSIAGSPTNDANSRYNQEELKSATSYNGFDFYNTWSVDGIFNNGYPYFSRNSYVVNPNDLQVPEGFVDLISKDLINIADLKQTSDGFTLCTKSLDKILAGMGVIDAIGTSVDGSGLSLEILDDWYLFCIGTNYSILKMRPGLYDEVAGVGTSIPFLDFDISVMEAFHNELTNQVGENTYELQLYNELKKLTEGICEGPDYAFCEPIANYFATFTSEANHLIAEEYIQIIIANECDENGYIEVPSILDLSHEQKEYLESLTEIYDFDHSRIKVNPEHLTHKEKGAILISHSGNKTLNNYAAENICHAMATKGLEEILNTTFDETIIINNVSYSREQVEDWFHSAVKSDAGVGEEWFPKDMFPMSAIADSLTNKFGDV